MKANEAPEKIYLDIEPNLDDCTWHLTNPNGDSVEYTRTDAFIEKAEKYLQEHLIDYWSQGVTDENKFIDEFRNYMKGE